ncbi:hypothetical protein PRIPAC_71594 [Pristionchus pacificus]|uniref:Uncharacterized protein n=1 Tax=Pristionchus pacificus TaxID=54126 RepID=A0A454XIK9_PRIPA|nr:hypothetical protein PRIPAC_71594 [Pristionchus pacificus]|eukprot:PDM80560.1 hypothetical protein PRIPAC_35563 [Pristionchus pacificus]
MQWHDQQIWTTVVEDNDYRRERDTRSELQQRQQAAEEAKRYRELYYQAMAEMQMMKMKLGKD